jgi:exodeoxyribonuclease V alpha subunit
VAFLDKLPHVGPVRARDIFETFGDDLWDVLENEPVRLTEVSGISEQHIDGIITAYEEMKASRDVLVKLYGFGLTEWQIRKIMDTYKGEDVVKIVTETPYRMIDDIDMFGFIRVDEIALKAGIYQDDPARIRAGVEYVVGEQSNTEGHILIAIPHLIKSAIILFSTTSAKIGTPNMVTEAMTRKGVEELISGGRLVIVDGFVAIRDLYYAEKTILEFCKEGGIANEQ